MNATSKLKTPSDKIADLITELVNAVDGPVTLSQIDREVAGFASKEHSGWYFTLPYSRGDAFIWGGHERGRGRRSS